MDFSGSFLFSTSSETVLNNGADTLENISDISLEKPLQLPVNPLLLPVEKK